MDFASIEFELYGQYTKFISRHLDNYYMQFVETKLKGSYIIEPTPFKDERGAFERVFCKSEMKGVGLNKEIVQINRSHTVKKGAVRGLHYQTPPYCENKIVKCISGKVFDVIVDIRKGSPTFLEWQGIELSAENMFSLFIPEGFAHGFQVLQNNSELLYMHTQFYNKESEAALNFLDPKLSIVLPQVITEMSERDKTHPFTQTNFDGIVL